MRTLQCTVWVLRKQGCPCRVPVEGAGCRAQREGLVLVLCIPQDGESPQLQDFLEGIKVGS